MSLKTLFISALATGFAAAKPVHAPQQLPAYPKRSFNNGAFSNGNFNGDGFNFIDGFNNFNQQQQVINIREENLQINNNGFQQQVVQQVNEVLIVDQQNNGFNNDLNNLFRRSNFARNFNDVTTVMLVVQEIQVAVDDGFGNQFQQNVFAQSVEVANRGAFNTETIMLFQASTLIAQNILGGGFNGFNNGGFGGVGGVGGFAAPTGGASFPTKTADVQLFGAKPTWSSVVEDPAASIGAVWQKEIQDLQNNEQDGADNQINVDAASQEAQNVAQATATASSE